ncbi:biotin synthase [Nitrosophilus alvini]|uniref:biotin synthase n=1 Tax=Nitrosophilus alvini TaxID=2714855 RepID=UPI00190D425A|nr:biotin synthase [Nitrosophilus alvini]
MKKVFLCAISNISSGRCLEDCRFCTQSVRYKADIQRYEHKPIETIVKEAVAAKKMGALGFCLVTSGKGIDDKKLEFVCEAARAVKKVVNDFNLIGCCGTADVEQLKELKSAGIDSYNHNLETHRDFYKKICSTHEWDERYQTCLNVKAAGLKLCSGGIFGLGESKEQRVEFLEQIKSLSPDSTPINFYHPNPSLPLEAKILEAEEALSIVKLAREILPDVKLMVAGGREITLKDEWYRIFEMGADAIVIGDYLTTKGNEPHKDIETIKSLGLEIAVTCHE